MSLIKNFLNEIYFIKSEKIPTEIFTFFLEESCYIKNETDLFLQYKIKVNC